MIEMSPRTGYLYNARSLVKKHIDEMIQEWKNPPRPGSIFGVEGEKGSRFLTPGCGAPASGYITTWWDADGLFIRMYGASREYRQQFVEVYIEKEYLE